MLMSLDDVKSLYVLSCFVLCLIILSPTFAVFLFFPSGERFSELWVLGSGHMAEDYPFDVEAGGVYRIYLGIGNRMGDLRYYRVYVKFRNQTEALPDVSNGMPSVLDPVFEYRLFLRDSETWEREVLFSFEGVSFEGNVCRVSGLVVGGCALSVDKYVLWDEVNRGFYFQLFFELWLYDASVSDFRYHDRFVGIWLNMTASE